MVLWADILDEATRAAVQVYTAVGAIGFILIYVAWFFRYPPPWYTKWLTDRNKIKLVEIESKAALQQEEMEQRARERGEAQAHFQMGSDKHREHVERLQEAHRKELELIQAARSEDVERLATAIKEQASANERVALSFREELRTEREWNTRMLHWMVERASDNASPKVEVEE